MTESRNTAYSSRRSEMDESNGAPTAAQPSATQGSSDVARRSRWRGVLIGVGVLGVLAGGLAYGAWRYHERHSTVLATAQRHRDFVPTVRVAEVRASDDVMRVTLPATTLAWTTANIFARASGYIDKRNVDIGDHVKEGEL